jgi:hypothetical protein
MLYFLFFYHFKPVNFAKIPKKMAQFVKTMRDDWSRRYVTK